LAVVVIASSGGWLLASLALRPIENMTRAAAEISEKNLRHRLDVTTAPSEMQDLAATLNGAFDRLEDAFGRLRKFTADASHELRTPLAIASSHVQLALSRERSGEDYRKTLTTCRAALDRMGRLVESMLTLARLDAETARAPSKTCDASRLAAEAVALLRPLAEEHNATIAGPDPEAEAVLVSADPDRLLQVILNLAGNAIYYNRPEGRVDVTVWAEGAEAVLRIADQGEGIAPEDQPRIFERFFRADKSRSRRRGGAGLGLSIVKRIVELHDGKISFTSVPGEGTTFEVRLPLVAPEASLAEGTISPAAALDE
ncbi:MAG TPA: ATP-binding protein, partial [Pirellulales bacterium]